jgi:hypothetical protein
MGCPGGERPGRRLAAAVVALVVGLVSPACAASGDEGDDVNEASGTLSLLTYDVGGIPQEFTQGNPTEHIPLISPLLNDYDLVLTQNDYDWWPESSNRLDLAHYHERLRAQATHEYRSGRHPGPAPAGLDPTSRPDLQLGDGLGVLSRIPFVSRYPLDDVLRMAWTGCAGGFEATGEGESDCLTMRGFALVTLQLAAGATVDVYTFHTEVGSTPEDQRLRAADLEQLALFIQQRSAGNAVIVAGATMLAVGDERPGASGMSDAELWDQFLDRTTLTDACAALGCEAADAPDRVAFRSGDGVTLEATSLEVPRDRFRAPSGADLSYRPPVAVDLRWRAAS